MGIDAGSTTTKVALIDEDGALLYSYYGSNEGNPLNLVRKILKDLYHYIPEWCNYCKFNSYRLW